MSLCAFMDAFVNALRAFADASVNLDNADVSANARRCVVNASAGFYSASTVDTNATLR